MYIIAKYLIVRRGTLQQNLDSILGAHTRPYKDPLGYTICVRYSTPQISQMSPIQIQESFFKEDITSETIKKHLKFCLSNTVSTQWFVEASNEALQGSS